MHISAEVEAVLRRRAEQMAKRVKEKKSAAQKISVTVVGAGTERFGIPTSALSCIVKTPKIVPLPNLPPWLKGMAQIRGELVGAVDIADWFGVPEKSGSAFMAVVEGAPGKLGLLVDHVIGFKEIGDADLAERFGAMASLAGHPIAATTKDLVAVIDIKKMFSSPDLKLKGGAKR